MEQIQDEMRMNQGKKGALAGMRAIEKQRKMPQNLMSTELEHSSRRMKGGNAAGLARVVGSGRKRGGGKREPSSDSSSSDSSMEGGAKHMGRMMFAHLAKTHGEGYARKFMAGGAAPRGPMPPAGVEVLHARMSPAQVGLPGSGLGGQDVPPGGMAPMAYGTAPQAPPSFARNSISLGAPGLLPSAQVGSGKHRKHHHAPSVHHEMDMEGGKAARNVRGVYDGPEPAVATVVKGGARAARGAAISRLMKEKGMTLPEASKYLKEHGMK